MRVAIAACVVIWAFGLWVNNRSSGEPLPDGGHDGQSAEIATAQRRSIIATEASDRIADGILAIAEESPQKGSDVIGIATDSTCHAASQADEQSE
eukprot:1304616-Pyramimonas_sp.AAC.2